MTRIAIAAFGICLSSTAFAVSWDRYEIKDEMRGTTTQGASITANATYDPSVSLTMQIIDKGDLEQAVIFQLKGARADCAKEICDLNVRFDEGAVMSESMAVNPDRTTIIPTKTSTFAGAVGLSPVVYVEIPVLNKPAMQFKFDIEGAPFPRIKNPSFKFAGVALGDSAAKLPPQFVAANGTRCHEARNVGGQIPNQKIASVKMCFYKDMLYLVMIDTLGKSDYAAMSKYMTAQLGKRDSESYLEQWPANPGKVLDPRAVSATFWPMGKQKGAGQFFVMDESISYLVPEKQPAK